MSKYTTKVVELNKDKDSIALQANECAAILNADLSAQIKTQEGIIIRKQSALNIAELDVLKAEYYLTNDVDLYLCNLSEKWNIRDKAAAELEQAEAVLEKLQEIIKIFV